MRCGVVVASAPGALDELKRAPQGIDVLAVNYAGIDCLRPLAAWGSVHADQLEGWVSVRRNRGGKDVPHVFGESFLPGSARDVVSYYGPVRWRGSSALYVVQWALEHGYDRLALVGVHLTGHDRSRAGVIHPAEGFAYNSYRRGWTDAFDTIDGRVKSFGGWTAELLGEPDERFFKG